MPQTTGFTLWLTGMSLSGKTTLASLLAARFRAVGRPVEVLDDNELSEPLAAKELGPTQDERNAIVRRLGLIAKLLTRNDVLTIVAAVSPYREPRDQIRREIGRFVEIFVDCPTDKLIERDTKGLYKKALSGELPNFTGVTDPYQTPSHAEVTLRTDLETPEEAVAHVLQGLVDYGYLRPEDTKAMLGKKLKPMKPTRAGKGAKAKAARPAKAPKAARRPAAKRPAPKARPAKRDQGKKKAKRG